VRSSSLNELELLSMKRFINLLSTNANETKLLCISVELDQKFWIRRSTMAARALLHTAVIVILLMEHLLSQAAVGLTIRSEVEATLRSVLHDVEHAYTLEQALRNHNALQHYHEKLGALKVRYEEREALWEEERREKERLGLLLTEEIVKLSAHELREEKLKRDLQIKIQQLEIEREDLLKQQQKQSIAVRVESDAITPSNATPNEAEAPTPKHANVATPETKSSIILEAQAHASAVPLEEPTEQVEVVNMETSISSVPTIAELLLKIEEPALMAIFAFLSPLEIMNLAQINRAMYSKVNAMFGQTSEVSAGEANTTTTAETATAAFPAATTAAATAASNASATASPASGNSIKSDEFPAEIINNLKALGFQEEKVISCMRASSGDPNVAAEYLMNGIPPGIVASTGKGTAQTPKSSPTLVGMAGPSGHKRQNSGTSVATTGTTGTTGSGGGGNPFSQMTSWFGAAETSSSASTAPSSAASGASTSTDTGEIKLNAAMASSMASKLTPAELSIILRMRERLQKCEADAIKYRQEKEDVTAKLQSVEAVKEFLVTKVRDTEKAAKEKDEEMKRVKSKALTDQEVITFLDEKVKRLEKEVNDLKSNEHATRKEAHDIVSKNEKKVVVLTDMLRFERQQIAANEKEWKAAKKVLIKEVKSCRARIVSLEAEYQGCLQQNSQLKQGLLSQSGQGSPGKKSLKFR
jgi:hypothetical protein